MGSDENQKMPQIVETLAAKSVTQVSVGMDFVIALGQDYDENGSVIEGHIQEAKGAQFVPTHAPPIQETSY